MFLNKMHSLPCHRPQQSFSNFLQHWRHCSHFVTYRTTSSLRNNEKVEVHGVIINVFGFTSQVACEEATPRLWVKSKPSPKTETGASNFSRPVLHMHTPSLQNAPLQLTSHEVSVQGRADGLRRCMVVFQASDSWGTGVVLVRRSDPHPVPGAPMGPGAQLQAPALAPALARAGSTW